MATTSSFDALDIQIIINGHLYQPSDIGLFRVLIAFEDDGDSGVELHCQDNDCRVADGADFQPGQVMSIKWGMRLAQDYSDTYGGFVIQKPSTEYGEDGITSVVKAYTKSGLLAASRPQKVYNNKTLKEIVNDIAGRVQMEVVWKNSDSGSEKVPAISQATWTDRQLLSTLAQRYGYQVSYVGNTLIFDRITYSETPDHCLRYHKGEDSIIKSASVSMDAKKDGASGTTATGFNPKDKKETKETGKAPEMSLGVSAVDGTEAAGQAPAQQGVTPVNAGSSPATAQPTGFNMPGLSLPSGAPAFGSGAQAGDFRQLLSQPATTDNVSQSHATAFKFNTSKKKCGLQLTCAALPWAKIRMLVEVQGLSKRDSGNWYVSKVSHELSKSGCLTSLECNRSKHNAGGGASKDSKVNDKKAGDSGEKKEEKYQVDAVNGSEGKVTK